MMLADHHIQKFLAAKEVVVLATVQPDGAPLAMPMWFLHDLATLIMISVEGTQKVRNLRRDPRVCVVAEAVSDVGKTDFLADGPERKALADRFHAKYPGLARLWGGREMPANRVMFRITPARVRSWGLESVRDD